MAWDEVQARKAVDDFYHLFRKLETAHPDCVKQLRHGWRDNFTRCGHKRLGRILLGYSPEEACRARASAR